MDEKDKEFTEITGLDESDELDENECIIILQDEDGNDVEFEYLDAVELEGREFVILLPTDEEDTDVVILEAKPSADDPDMEDYLPVPEDEDELLDRVYEIFKERFKDEFDFVEDEEEE